MPMLKRHTKVTGNHVSTPQIRKERCCPPLQKEVKSDVSNLIEIEASPEFMIPKLNGSGNDFLTSVVNIVRSESRSGGFQNDRGWKRYRE